MLEEKDTTNSSIFNELKNSKLIIEQHNSEIEEFLKIISNNENSISKYENINKNNRNIIDEMNKKLIEAKHEISMKE